MTNTNPSRGLGRLWSWAILLFWLGFGIVGIWMDQGTYKIATTLWVILTAGLYYLQGRWDSLHNESGLIDWNEDTVRVPTKAPPDVAVVKKMAEIPPQEDSDSSASSW